MEKGLIVKNAGLVLVVLSLLTVVHPAFSEETNDFWQRPSLTDGFRGLADALQPSGIDIGLSITNIYQQNTHGGTSTHRHQGRWSGSFDLEMEFDLQTLAGIEGGTIYMHSEGTWSRKDIDETSIQSLFGVNGDFAPREAFNIIELWYQQSLWDDTLQVRMGKLDMTGGFECRGSMVSFDSNRYANDENTQFLNSALINNPTIPFPDYGIGAIVLWSPVENWYVSVGAADAQADKRESGLNTAFHDEDYFITMAETGILPQLDSANGPLPGVYRAGIWYDGQPKPSLDESRFYRDDTGCYLSFDQMLTRESSDPADTQGLGAFFRYGYANGRCNAVTNFFSGGIQYEGLLEGRPADVLGIGYAHGALTDRSASPFTKDFESVLEVYYSLKAAGWLFITPSLQYAANPGGTGDSNDALVFGVRTLLTF
ncbi:MAG TPA: carbohydrate porin [Anaerohalosphaeraceae bacterium]|nr:carbohydrate porin [Anaerohalosphaeraceae bacterium]